MAVEWRVLIEKRGAGPMKALLDEYTPDADAAWWSWAAREYAELAGANRPYPGGGSRYDLPGETGLYDIADQAYAAQRDADHLAALAGIGWRKGCAPVNTELFAGPLAGEPTPTWLDPSAACTVLRHLALYAAHCAALIEDRIVTLRADVEVRRNVPGWEQCERLPDTSG